MFRVVAVAELEVWPTLLVLTSHRLAVSTPSFLMSYDSSVVVRIVSTLVSNGKEANFSISRPRGNASGKNEATPSIRDGEPFDVPLGGTTLNIGEPLETLLCGCDVTILVMIT